MVFLSMASLALRTYRSPKTAQHSTACGGIVRVSSNCRSLPDGHMSNGLTAEHAKQQNDPYA